MKRKLSMLLVLSAALTMLSACGNTDKTEHNENLSVSEPTAETEQTTTAAEPTNETDIAVPGALNSADYVLNVEFTPIYEDVGFMDNPIDGYPVSYEEMHEYINNYQNITFVGYEIVSQYTPEEAYEKTGNEIFLNSTMLYKAHIYYDYLNDTTVDMTVDLAKAGMPDQQLKNNPPYVIGQKLISPLSGFFDDSCVAIPELVYYVYDIGGTDFAYHVDNEDICISSGDYPNIDLKIYDDERFLVTAAANNPVKFTQKSTVDDLTRFIRQDWTSRGYEFFDVANFDYDARPKNDLDEDVAEDVVDGEDVTREIATNKDFEMPVPFVSDDGDRNMNFYATVNLKLGFIDMSFINLAGYDEFESWVNSASSSTSEYTSVAELANLYSLIKHFNISEDFVREKLVSFRNGSDDDFSDEEIDLILSGDDEAVAEHFAADTAIVKGSNIYSLKWIFYHSPEDYAAAGITAEELEAKLPMYDSIALTEEARNAIAKKINYCVNLT